VLAIVGLAGGLPFYMRTIATIALGAGLFIEGTSLGAALGGVVRQGFIEESAPASGFALQGMAGAAGIVLGILSLIGVLPGVLIPVALITMGGAMAFAGPSRAELNVSALEVGGASDSAKRIAGQAVSSSGSVLTLAGLGALTLGILTLVTFGPYAPTLLLVALLVLGAALLLSDSMLLGRVGTSFLRFGQRGNR
jgi:hypothetical protein